MAGAEREQEDTLEQGLLAPEVGLLGEFDCPSVSSRFVFSSVWMVVSADSVQLALLYMFSDAQFS